MVCAYSRVSHHQHSGEAYRMSSFEACLGHFEDLNDHAPVRLESRGSLCCFGPGCECEKDSPFPAGVCQMSALTSSRFLVCLNYVNVVVATGRGIRRSKTRDEVCSSVGPGLRGVAEDSGCVRERKVEWYIQDATGLCFRCRARSPGNELACGELGSGLKTRNSTLKGARVNSAEHLGNRRQSIREQEGRAPSTEQR
jgi:hypothetical protein